jgi:two-component system chemotaxis sensor kinase CheA
MDNEFKDLIPEFVEEARPLAEGLLESLLTFDQLADIEPVPEECMQQVKNALHTLKGNSGMLGQEAIQTLTHAMEDCCGRLSDHPEERDAAIVDLLVDAGEKVLELIETCSTDPVPSEETEELLQAFQQWLGSAESSPAGVASVTKERAEVAGIRGEHRSNDVIRIDFKKLDKLLDLVGEAIISQSTVDEICSRLVVRDPLQREELDRAVQSLVRTLQGLQERLVGARLLPISTVFQRFSRSVRSLARESERAVRLVIEGGDTTIDKSMIDRLGEPLLHLVRNAVAHGIETPEERAKAGKPEKATITLKAEHRSGRVLVSVTDDGRGLDIEKIRARAIDAGWDAASMSATELEQLIYQPGFSTSSNVSTLSGRGVGLDVVASATHDIGGALTVESRAGEGTAFLLNLPLTMAVSKAQFVEIDEELYALPLSNVVETMRLQWDAVHFVERRAMVPWRGEYVPLIDGGRLLETGNDSGRRRYCVVLTTGDRHCGLLVDRTYGQREIVVKGLDLTLKNHELLSGVTLLGDGRIVFILDAASLARGEYIEQAAPQLARGFHDAAATA